MWQNKRARRWLTLALVLGTVFAILSRPDVALREIGKQPPAPPPLPADLADLHVTVAGWESATPAERAAYGRWFVLALEANRAHMHNALSQRSDRRQQAISSVLGKIFMGLIASSFALLLLPLLLWRRYAGRRRRFAGYCVLASVLLASSFFAFQVLVMGVASVSSGLVRAVNPQQPMLDAALDHAESNIDLWTQPGEAGSVPLGPTMGALDESGGGDFVGRFVENLRYLDMRAMERMAKATHVIYVLLGFGPNVGAVLIAIVFLLTMGFVFRSILAMPFRGARGEAKAGRAAVRLALLSLWRELCAVVMFMISLLPAWICIHFAVRFMAYGLFDGMLDQVMSLIDYMGRLTEAPSELPLTLGMVALPVLLLLTVGVFLLSAVGYTVWARRITQLRYHRGVRIRTHGRYFRRAWGRMFRIQWSLGLVLFFGLPAIMAITGQPPHGSMDAALSAITWTGALAALLLVAGVLVFGVVQDLFWFVRFRPTMGVGTIEAAEPAEPAEHPATIEVGEGDATDSD